jgi:hypothetical protein
MQVALQQPTQAFVNESGFLPIPGWLIGLIASWLFLILARRIGKNTSPESSKLVDLLADILNLLAAGSIVASISSTPLITSLSESITRNITSWTIGEGFLSSSVTIGGTVLLGILVVIAGYLYITTETKWWLFWFGIGLQALAILAPWINTALSWWINHPITWVWNFIIWALTSLPNITINF